MNAALNMARAALDDAVKSGDAKVAAAFKKASKSFENALLAMTGKKWRVKAGADLFSATDGKHDIDIYWDWDPMRNSATVTVEGPKGYRSTREISLGGISMMSKPGKRGEGAALGLVMDLASKISEDVGEWIADMLSEVRAGRELAGARKGTGSATEISYANNERRNPRSTKKSEKRDYNRAVRRSKKRDVARRLRGEDIGEAMEKKHTSSWAKKVLASYLRGHKVKTEMGPRRTADVSEFMLMKGTPVNGYWQFKHSDSRNYIFVDDAKESVVIPTSGKAFMHGTFDLHSVKAGKVTDSKRSRAAIKAVDMMARDLGLSAVQKASLLGNVRGQLLIMDIKA